MPGYFRSRDTEHVWTMEYPTLMHPYSLPLYRIAASMLALLVLVVVLGLLSSQPLAAQNYTYPCANGPGPGERQVGYQDGGNGIAGFPVCVRDEPVGPAPPPMQAVDNYYAAAWHATGSANAWLSAGYASSSDAEAAAIAACNRDMGGGCSLAQSNVNGGLSIARGMNGSLYAASRPTARQADSQVLKACDKANDFCVVINGLTATPGRQEAGTSVRRQIDIFRPQGNFRKTFGVAVWGSSASDPGIINTIYIATGHASMETAQQAALEACQKQGGGNCEVARIISDTFFVAIKRSDNLMSISSSPTEKMAVEIARKTCPKKIKCTVTAVIPAWQGGIVEHQPFAAKQ